MRKRGDTGIEYKRDVKHNSNFFKKNISKKWRKEINKRIKKNQGDIPKRWFFLDQKKIENKTQEMEMRKGQKSSKKREKQKTKQF